MSQTYTYIDPAGNQAQYTLHDVNHRNEYYWSTEQGDHGVEASYAKAMDRARTALKASMAERRRAAQAFLSRS